MLTLSLLPETFTVCRLECDHPIPQWAATSSFFSMTRTFDELSIVCPERNVPEGVRSNSGWKCLKVKGPIDFSAIGIVQSLTRPLASANISIFVMSTFDTDYVMVKKEDVDSALRALASAGHQVQ